MIDQPKHCIDFNTTIINDSFCGVTNKKSQFIDVQICRDTKNIVMSKTSNKIAVKFSLDMHHVNITSVAENYILKKNRKNNFRDNHRSRSLTDSEDSESSLSCDSLNYSEFVQQAHWNRMAAKLKFLPNSLLRDIRNCKLSESNKNKNDDEDYLSKKKNDKRNIPENIKYDLIKHSGKNEQILSHTYENDIYYEFHINETTLENAVGLEQEEFKDESFAGYTDINGNNSAIRSNKGTVRGVKNRVRNGIATFLQMQVASSKIHREQDLGKVIIYTTSMGIVRSTFAKCMNMKQILRTLLIKFEERDVFMSTEYQQEIKERMKSIEIYIPQLFVEGQHIGDSETIERLNESGELRKMLQPYKAFSKPCTCQICGGYRLLPCSSCNGSKKSIHRNHFTAEFIALKCMNCDEVGLVKCHAC